MAVGDVALGSSGLGFASRSGSSARPPAGRGVVGAACEILLCISPPQGSRMGRREDGAVPSCQAGSTSPSINRSTFRVVSGNNFRFPRREPLVVAVFDDKASANVLDGLRRRKAAFGHSNGSKVRKFTGRTEVPR